VPNPPGLAFAAHVRASSTALQLGTWAATLAAFFVILAVTRRRAGRGVLSAEERRWIVGILAAAAVPVAIWLLTR
jgi:hypothetical protein